ncbi:hypothetical protein C8D87_1021048 [Lentzea atacamensis]|uniref:Ig-like domain-containing protein n=1 Tax=Lentzea atacamensis TaxID=531938 RepID=A0ABX9EES9_9PSEU|nr:hypothetical protein [Lentzea atacamensis]RAS68970.1 hypothetical protein C8D87_1021048 [Lentzea atacamensis]
MRSRGAPAIAVALSAAVVFAPLAVAQQQEPTLQVTATVKNRGLVRAETGPCATYSTVTSPGFKEPITLSGDANRLSGNGWATIEAGSYTATVQCDGKTLTAQFTVLPLEIHWQLHPAEVEPGGTITAEQNMSTGCYATGPLTSPGFAAPLKFTRGGNFGRLSGDTTVITTPGTYEVVFQCAERPERSVKTFRILGTPPTSAPTTPPPAGNPAPKPKPKPIVKPKGAPETGGGTARG